MMLSSAPRGRSLIPGGSRSLHGGAVCLPAILLAAMFGLITMLITMPAQGGGAAVSIFVDRATEVAKVSPLMFGVNTACWDEQLFPGTADNWELTFDQVGVRRVKDAGIRFLRFPSGPPARARDAGVTDGSATLRLRARSLVAVTIPGKAAPPPRPRKLAFRAKVTASSRAEVDGMFGPESAVDGNMRTRWAYG